MSDGSAFTKESLLRDAQRAVVTVIVTVIVTGVGTVLATYWSIQTSITELKYEIKLLAKDVEALKGQSATQKVAALTTETEPIETGGLVPRHALEDRVNGLEETAAKMNDVLEKLVRMIEETRSASPPPSLSPPPSPE
jgi:hypothetical protein